MDIITDVTKIDRNHLESIVIKQQEQLIELRRKLAIDQMHIYIDRVQHSSGVVRKLLVEIANKAQTITLLHDCAEDSGSLVVKLDDVVELADKYI